MIKVSSSEIQNKFGQYLDATQLEDIVITKQGREFAYLVSPKVYKHLKELEDAIEDAYLSEIAKEAKETEDWLSLEESEKLHQRMLHAQG